mmetsp:Transcript_16551/g.67948  ORF Transcript_16551/g.67948 Transcript_16551/m.67948 type:complete len:128 (+) Transcript_16551:1980-2363(+)
MDSKQKRFRRSLLDLLEERRSASTALVVENALPRFMDLTEKGNDFSFSKLLLPFFRRKKNLNAGSLLHRKRLLIYYPFCGPDHVVFPNVVAAGRLSWIQLQLAPPGSAVHPLALVVLVGSGRSQPGG